MKHGHGSPKHVIGFNGIEVEPQFLQRNRYQDAGFNSAPDLIHHEEIKASNDYFILFFHKANIDSYPSNQSAQRYSLCGFGSASEDQVTRILKVRRKYFAFS